jgi:NOL1/NOP2/fmu family ribosome biogenesis protein
MPNKLLQNYSSFLEVVLKFLSSSLLMPLVGFLLIALAIGITILKKRSSSGDSKEPWPYYVKRPLTQPEQVLYHRLIKALPEHIVLAQVQVSRVLGVKKGFNFSEWSNRINRMSYDFVICAKDSTVLAAIELDDKSHEANSRLKADEKKDKATFDAGVRLIRWQAKALPDEVLIKTTFASLIITRRSSTDVLTTA